MNIHHADISELQLRKIPTLSSTSCSMSRKRTMPNSRFRSRTFAPKHLGACRTCRLRHVRCDQKRPRCTPCTTSSRVCELGSTSSDDELGSRLKVVTWEPKKKSPPRHIPSTVSKPPEARACQYFQEVVVKSLVEVFDSPFWTDTVLRTMAMSKSLRHAVIALSSLWEGNYGVTRKSLAQKEVAGAMALKHYGIALTETQRALSAPQTLSFEELIVGGIIFLCFEMFQGHTFSALSQMSTLFQVFCEWQDCSKKQYDFKPLLGSDTGDAVEAQLVCVRSRLLLQSLLFPATHMIDRKLLQPVYCLEIPTIPDRFDSIDEARDCFCACTSSMIHGSLAQAFQGSELDAREASTRRPLFNFQANILQQWYSAFEKLNTDCSKSDEKERAGVAVLKMHYLMMSILMRSLAVQTEMGFDNCMADFIEIVEHGNRILALGCNIPKNFEVQQPTFDMGILPPAYFVATRCRHPDIRRQAVDLLRNAPQREGIWEAAMLIRLAEIVIVIEENSCEKVTCSDDVSESARLRLQNVFITSPERKIEAHFLQGTGEAGESNLLRESIFY